MAEVAILTPDPGVDEYAELWRTVLARLQAALDGEGIRAVPTPWTAHVDSADGLRGFDRVLPLLVWSYHLDHARWLRACATWEEAGLPMSNPAATLAWNTDKRYLADLAARGVAIPHTLWAERLTPALLGQAFEETGADELIVKPSVSGGAWRTLRVARDGIDEAVAAAGDGGGDMLVQPFLPAIASEGETSLLYFGGRLSHAVNKRPVPGDFRVQETFGGRYALLAEASAGAVELAERTLAAIEAPLLYARIDMVPGDDGWLLMEAELIEPDFYLGAAAGGGTNFAKALRREITG